MHCRQFIRRKIGNRGDVLSMNAADNILEYLKETYHPSVVIAYGSFATAANDSHSDFDALVITENAQAFHDASVVDGILLDVFLYAPEYFTSHYEIAEIQQIYDGTVLIDRNGLGAALKQEALAYVNSYQPKSEEEKRMEVSWCRKMLQRAERGDAEGYYRWHWLLTDSLEIYCDLAEQRYFGPKKSLAYLKQTNAEAYEIYQNALTCFDGRYLKAWVEYLEHMFNHMK